MLSSALLSFRVRRKSFHISTSQQSGNILILLRSVLASSAGEPTVKGSCYRGPKSLVATGVLGRWWLRLKQDKRYRNSVLFQLPFHSLINNRRKKNHNPKQLVTTLTFELEIRLKLKVDKVGLLLRHLYRYKSVCFLKPNTPLKLPGWWSWKIVFAWKTHTIWHKPRKEASIRSASTQRMWERIYCAL